MADDRDSKRGAIERAAHPAEAATMDASDAGDATPRVTAGEGSPAAGAGAYHDYVIKGEHGRGGLGRVLRAHDRWLGRPVALKELLHRDPAATARFLREARLAARLQHPGIVPVYELAFRDDGAPFYTMKLIAGERFDKRIARARTLDDRLALLPHVLAVAEAVAYAHDCSIIHRDLKPSNVIVGEFGETIVIDWGLAKDLAELPGVAASDEVEPPVPPEVEPPEIDDTLLALGEAGSSDRTRAGRAMGTLAYMPPEQLRGDAVDERADVFAIGATLFHTITGAPPYDGDSSTEVRARIAEARLDDVAKLAPGVPPDLAAIVRKATSRLPEDRYPTAKELAADLRRFQAGQLVSAHVYTRATLVRRWLGRHRRAAITAAAFVLALVTLGVVSVRRVIAERDRAEAERARAEAEATRAADRAQELTFVEARASLDRDPAASLAWLKTARLDAASYARAAGIALDAQARGAARHVWRVPGSVNDATFTPDGAQVVSVGTHGALLAWDVASGALVARLPEHARVRLVHVTSDGRTLVVVTEAGSLLFVDRATGATREVPRPGGAKEHALSHDGRAVVAGESDGRVRLFAVATGAERELAHVPAAVRDVAFGPDDTWIAVAADDGVRIFDRASGRERRFATRIAEGPYELCLHVSPDGARIVTSEPGSVLRAWDVATGASRVLLEGQGQISAGAFAGSDVFVSGSDDGTVRAWDLAHETVRVLLGHSAFVNAIAASPDGARAVSCSDDATARVWDLRAMTSRVLRGHTATVLACTFSRDGRWIVSGGTDGDVRLWEAETRPETVLGTHRQDVFVLAWSPDGARVATGDESGDVRVWDVARPGEAVNLEGHRGNVRGAAFVGVDRLVTVADDGARVWSLATRASTAWPTEAPVQTMAVASDGRTVAAGSADGRVHAWTIDATGARAAAHAAKGHDGSVRSVAFAPDGARLASGGDDGVVRTWDAATGAPLLTLRGHGNRVTGVAFVRGGAEIASSSWDGTVRLWNAATGAPVRVLDYADRVGPLAASPDGLRVVAPNHDRTARLWDLASGASVLFRGHADSLGEAIFSPDGRRVATASDDGSVRLWDAATGRLLDERRSASAVMVARFSPDGSRVASAGWDDAVRAWPVDESTFVPEGAAGLRAWLDRATSAVVGDQSSVASVVGDATR